MASFGQTRASARDVYRSTTANAARSVSYAETEADKLRAANERLENMSRRAYNQVSALAQGTAQAQLNAGLRVGEIQARAGQALSDLAYNLGAKYDEMKNSIEDVERSIEIKRYEDEIRKEHERGANDFLLGNEPAPDAGAAYTEGFTKAKTSRDVADKQEMDRLADDAEIGVFVNENMTRLQPSIQKEIDAIAADGPLTAEKVVELRRGILGSIRDQFGTNTREGIALLDKADAVITSISSTRIANDKKAVGINTVNNVVANETAGLAEWKSAADMRSSLDRVIATGRKYGNKDVASLRSDWLTSTMNGAVANGNFGHLMTLMHEKDATGTSMYEELPPNMQAKYTATQQDHNKKMHEANLEAAKATSSVYKAQLDSIDVFNPEHDDLIRASLAYVSTLSKEHPLKAKDSIIALNKSIQAAVKKKSEYQDATLAYNQGAANRVEKQHLYFENESKRHIEIYAAARNNPEMQAQANAARVGIQRDIDANYVPRMVTNSIESLRAIGQNGDMGQQREEVVRVVNALEPYLNAIASNPQYRQTVLNSVKSEQGKAMVTLLTMGDQSGSMADRVQNMLSSPNFAVANRLGDKEIRSKGVEAIRRWDKDAKDYGVFHAELVDKMGVEIGTDLSEEANSMVSFMVALDPNLSMEDAVDAVADTFKDRFVQLPGAYGDDKSLRASPDVVRAMADPDMRTAIDIDLAGAKRALWAASDEVIASDEFTDMQSVGLFSGLSGSNNKPSDIAIGFKTLPGGKIGLETDTGEMLTLEVGNPAIELLAEHGFKMLDVAPGVVAPSYDVTVDRIYKTAEKLRKDKELRR